MGNSRDDRYVPDLIRAFREIEDERVQGMIAWALGRIGGSDAKTALTDFEAGRDGLVREEIALALDQF
jgi:epoxyqueuosine reductase